jgi:FdhD protein
VEEQLEIPLVHGPGDARTMKSISVTMRTPGDDFELAAGFLMTDGVVRHIDDVAQIVYAPENMAPTPEARGADIERSALSAEKEHSARRTGCGR